MTEFTCTLCKKDIMDVWQVGEDILCTTCYERVKQDLKSGKCKTCYKCRHIYYVGDYSFTVDGLEFKTDICIGCKDELSNKITKLFKEYGLKPDEEYLMDEGDINE